MTGQLDIIGVGMVTAVGLDAPSSCAAMRARLDGFTETRLIGSNDAWLVGAPVPLPRKWIGERRLAHLAAGAIAEAFDHHPPARDNAALILCLAEEERPGRLVRDAAALAATIARILEIRPRHHTRLVAHGRPSGHVALDQARRMLAAGEAAYVMIAGVDSYLGTLAIAHFLAAKRLLTPENPNGFIPGEAAAAILCAPPGTGNLTLRGLGLAREPAPIYNAEDRPLRGDGMTAAYRAALGEAGIEMNRLGYRVSDLVGEQYWFKQAALASLRLLRGRHDFQDLWSPAESLGNVGAAVGPLMIGMAWTAARKRYAAGDPVLVEASSDSGACAAALLGARAA